MKAPIRPSTVEGGNEGANTLFGTVDTLFDTVDREGVGNEEGANLLLLPPLWSALRLVIWGQQFPQFDGRYIRHICALHDETGNASGFKFAGYSHMHKTKA